MFRILMAGTALAVLGGCVSPAVERQAAVDVAAEAAADLDRAAASGPAEVPVPDNVLLTAWSGSYDGVPPWDQVRPDLFPQAFQFAIDERRREVLAIANSPSAPTFVNTVEAL